jgi:hypothetical protein
LFLLFCIINELFTVLACGDDCGCEVEEVDCGGGCDCGCPCPFPFPPYPYPTPYPTTTTTTRRPRPSTPGQTRRPGLRNILPAAAAATALIAMREMTPDQNFMKKSSRKLSPVRSSRKFSPVRSVIKRRKAGARQAVAPLIRGLSALAVGVLARQLPPTLPPLPTLPTLPTLPPGFPGNLSEIIQDIIYSIPTPVPIPAFPSTPVLYPKGPYDVGVKEYFKIFKAINKIKDKEEKKSKLEKFFSKNAVIKKIVKIEPLPYFNRDIERHMDDLEKEKEKEFYENVHVDDDHDSHGIEGYY